LSLVVAVAGLRLQVQEQAVVAVLVVY